MVYTYVIFKFDTKTSQRFHSKYKPTIASYWNQPTNSNNTTHTNTWNKAHPKPGNNVVFLIAVLYENGYKAVRKDIFLSSLGTKTNASANVNNNSHGQEKNSSKSIQEEI